MTLLARFLPLLSGWGGYIAAAVIGAALALLVGGAVFYNSGLRDGIEIGAAQARDDARIARDAVTSRQQQDQINAQTDALRRRGAPDGVCGPSTRDCPGR